jgi:hypothetical protein
VIGLIFFEDTLNSDRYVSDILEPFFRELTEEETRYGYFQQDSATARMACILCSVCKTCLMMNKLSAKAYGHLAPPISLFVTYLWGNLKGKVYKNNPQTACALKSEIRNVCSIYGDERQRVFRNLMTRCKACVREHGDHFQHLL